MTRLLLADNEVNPYLVTFGLYWFRVPAGTVADRGRNPAQTALLRLRKMPKRLRDIAEDIRWILAVKLPPPWGRQVQEMTANRTSIGSTEELEAIATSCERGAPMFESLHDVLRDQASGKRRPRNAYLVMLWSQMSFKLGKQEIGSILPILVDCADYAFGGRRRMMQSQAFEKIVARYQERFPGDYLHRREVAERCRLRLSPEEATMWLRLNEDD